MKSITREGKVASSSMTLMTPEPQPASVMDPSFSKRMMRYKRTNSVRVGREIVLDADDFERAVRRGHEGVPPDRAVMAVA